MIKKGFKKLNSIFPFSLTFPLPYAIPLYHSVSDEDLPHLKNVISYKNTKEFERDLDFMLRKFNFVDWDHFKNSFDKKNKRPCALLTFDDGLMEFKDVVLPILKRKGIYAVNFINPAFVDNSEMMFRFKTSLLIEKIKTKSYKVPVSVLKLLNADGNSEDEIIKKLLSITWLEQEKLDILAVYLDINFRNYLQKNKIYMNLEDLKHVKNEGFGIAAHSWDHPYYYDLSTDEQLSNTQRSLDYMREHNFVGDTFAFPFTDHNVSMEFFQKLFDGNKNLKFTFGISGLKLDDFPLNLHRIPMENGHTAENEINFESNYFQLKKIFNRNTLKRI